MTAQEYTSSMQTGSSVIIDKVKEIQQQRAEVLLVDLGSGDKWVVSNLYLLSLLAASRTNIRQLVFIATNAQTERRYVGMCAPEDLIGHVGTRLPSLVVAQSKTAYHFGSLVDYKLGEQFFSALNSALPGDSQAEQYKRWVTQGWLSATLGTALHEGQVEWRDRLDSEAYRFILAYPHQYVAAVRNGQYLCDQSIQEGRPRYCEERSAPKRSQ